MINGLIANIYNTSTIVLGRGYFAGGYTTTAVADIDGINFADETAINPAASLISTRYHHFAVNSASYGYFAGDRGPSSSIEKFSFSIEASSSLTATLISGRYGAAAVESSTRGYFFGGSNGTTALSEIDGIRFDTEAAINPAATLPTARYRHAGVKSSTRGYFGSGYTTISINITDAFTFATETSLTSSQILSVAKYAYATAESNERGYFMGGVNGSTTIDGMQFSTETTFVSDSVLNISKSYAAGASSDARGYAAGGNAPTLSNDIDGIRFDTEAAINPTTSLAVARYGLAGVESKTTQFLGSRGYIVGGYYGSHVDTIDALIFDTEAMGNPAAKLSVGRSFTAGVNSNIKGYACGGSKGSSWDSSITTNEIDGIVFSTEAAFNPATSLTVARRAAGAVNSSLKGYIGGGETVSPVLTAEIDGIIFSTESQFNPTTSLAIARYVLAGVNSSTNGYFGSGYSTVGLTREIDGIRFSDDALYNPTAMLTVARHGINAMNSTTKGYFGGGRDDIPSAPHFSTLIDGIVFATNTAFVCTSSLKYGRYGASAFNSLVRGYFAGGEAFGYNTPDIEGLIFATDTSINPEARLRDALHTCTGFQSGGIL